MVVCAALFVNGTCDAWAIANASVRVAAAIIRGEVRRDRSKGVGRRHRSVFAQQAAAVVLGRPPAVCVALSPAGRQGRERQPLRQLRLPCQPPHRLSVIHPFPAPLLAFQPVDVESCDIQFVEVVRRRCGGDCRHESCDFAAHARCKETVQVRHEVTGERKGGRGRG